MPMALIGANGDNETNIGMSRSLDFSLYDENQQELKVNNLPNPVDLWISRDPSLPIASFKLVDALNISHSNFSSKSSLPFQLINGFLVSGLNMAGSNASIHIQINPANKSLSYLALLKFGDNPILNENNKYFDILSLYCPNDVVKEENDSFYLMFANMSRVNAHKGYVGFSIIEMNTTDLDCQNKSLNSIETLIKLIKEKESFTDNFWLRVYSSGCYYMNTSNNVWTSYGMEILADSNLTHAHCLANHLTTFAGGFVVLPNAIDFNYVWSHASFLQNPVIYSTVIALITLYIVIGVWTRYMDCKDEQKIGVTLLSNDEDQHLASKERKYIYEIIVFTGMRANAGTTSNVSCFNLYSISLYLFRVFMFLYTVPERKLVIR